MIIKVAYIKNENGKWIVYSEAGKRLGGPYDTEEQAKKRLAQVHYFKKTAEYAPGIPQRGLIVNLPSINKPEPWEFVLHDHQANRAGRHFDLRLGDPITGHAHSWVVKEWPTPGNKTLAVQQSTHTTKYMDFSGVIESGYGAGSVAIADRDRIEIIHSTPDKITFYKYSGTGTSKYTLIRLDGVNWLLINHTATNATQIAPKYKMKELPKDYKIQPDDFVTPKIDGAYATVIMQPEKVPLVFSTRISKKTNQPIEYTAKIRELLEQRPPKSLGKTTVRAEVFATQDGKELPNRTLGGILNANVWKSRELQEQHKSPLQMAVTDVIKYNNKDVSTLPIVDKYKLINTISQQYPLLKNPLEVEKSVHFKEGKVIWKNGLPYKLKYKPDYDVLVQSIFPAVTKNGVPRAGGFIGTELNSSTPTRVGTGFTHTELQNMLNNPEEYIGRVAKVSAMEKHPSGKLRSPSFIDWHLDK